tara:strand:- start:25 stop:231 length:207 start_codon:yes stop_codon:yes gene_type:complete
LELSFSTLGFLDEAFFRVSFVLESVFGFLSADFEGLPVLLDEDGLLVFLDEEGFLFGLDLEILAFFFL